MKIENEFIPYEQALALKELGFDERTLGFYDYPSKEFIKLDSFGNFEGLYKYRVTAPLYQQAFRWLYQKLDIEKGVMPLDTESQQLLLKELIDKVSSKHLLV